MRIDKQIIESIVEGYLDDDDIEQDGSHRCSFSELVDKLVLELNHMDETAAALDANNDRLGNATKAYHAEVAECESERQEIISACTHHSTTSYDGVPGSGCNICGKVL